MQTDNIRKIEYDSFVQITLKVILFSNKKYLRARLKIIIGTSGGTLKTLNLEMKG